MAGATATLACGVLYDMAFVIVGIYYSIVPGPPVKPPEMDTPPLHVCYNLYTLIVYNKVNGIYF